VFQFRHRDGALDGRPTDGTGRGKARGDPENTAAAKFERPRVPFRPEDPIAGARTPTPERREVQNENRAEAKRCCLLGGVGAIVKRRKKCAASPNGSGRAI